MQILEQKKDKVCSQLLVNTLTFSRVGNILVQGITRSQEWPLQIIIFFLLNLSHATFVLVVEKVTFAFISTEYIFLSISVAH